MDPRHLARLAVILEKGAITRAGARLPRRDSTLVAVLSLN